MDINPRWYFDRSAHIYDIYDIRGNTEIGLNHRLSECSPIDAVLISCTPYILT